MSLVPWTREVLLSCWRVRAFVRGSAQHHDCASKNARYLVIYFAEYKFSISFVGLCLGSKIQLRLDYWITKLTALPLAQVYVLLSALLAFSKF